MPRSRHRALPSRRNVWVLTVWCLAAASAAFRASSAFSAFSAFSGANGCRRLQRCRHVGRAAESSSSSLLAETRAIREEIEALLSEIQISTGSVPAAPAAAGPPVLEQELPQELPQVPGSVPAGTGFPAAQEPAQQATVQPPVADRPLGGAAAAASEEAVPERSKVVVVSAGHDAGDIADFFIDDQLIPITGPEGRRGLNVVVIDPGTGDIVSARTYDVWGEPVEQNRAFVRDLASVPDGHTVLVALKDSGMEKLTMDAVDALEELGSSIDGKLGFREAYALVGKKGGKALAERRSQKMLLVDAMLPFKVQWRTAGTAPSTPLRPPPSPPPRPPPQQPPAPPATAAPASGGPQPEAPGTVDTAGRTWEEVLHMLDQVEKDRAKR